MTDHRRRSRRRLNLTSLLALASTSSALNLSQFQVITSNQIPKRCIRAYQSDIDGCTRSDFTNGRQCSASCVKGLEETAEKIDEACGDLNVSSGSLLGIVLAGGLVDTLCPGFQATTITTTVQPGTTQGFSTVPGATTTAKTTSHTTKETSKTTTSGATFITNPGTTTTTADSTTTQAATSEETSATSATRDIPSASSTSSSTDATSVQTTAQSTATSEPAQTSDDSQDDGPTPFIGGSPFDPAPIQSLGTIICLGYDPRVLVTAIFAGIFLLR
ncbi:hypothetical protein F4821DRAFT_174668 [Hypoxylon rubiginosum]|uniref:Uncharacterized protein n=1 Tax=Hypoxylon rubiginosum TaxID=110542 RepID=A0ACC0DGQ9_9PEZI|nr:hypothetical protein F4821DRAFT_174668 [Hypoxylon rubiginosum]